MCEMKLPDELEMLIADFGDAVSAADESQANRVDHPVAYEAALEEEDAAYQNLVKGILEFAKASKCGGRCNCKKG